MDTLHYDEVEYSLLPFRTGRRLILDRILEMTAGCREIREPALFLSRLFVRLKSADSILEKIRRKKLPVQHPSDIPRVMDDVLGFRLIVEDQAELQFLAGFLSGSFEVRSINSHPQNEQYGGKSVDLALVHRQDGQVYPFEVQLRTFLQHYWAGHSFFLFHKTDPQIASAHRQDLLDLSAALQEAETLVARISANRTNVGAGGTQSVHWQDWPIRNQAHLMVIGPNEQFIEERIVPLTGRDDGDHQALVRSKLDCYQQHAGAAVVECLCANFAAYLLNEPQVHVPAENLDRAAW